VDASDRLGKELAAQLLEEGVADLIPQRPSPRPARAPAPAVGGADGLGLGGAASAVSTVSPPREGDL
jgi:hypothetical protein